MNEYQWHDDDFQNNTINKSETYSVYSSNPFEPEPPKPKKKRFLKRPLKPILTSLNILKKTCLMKLKNTYEN